MHSKRITIFAGHYGSGKTTMALNYAVWLKSQGLNTVICDLDIVNPYFRTLDSEAFLSSHGIKLISPQYANTNVDLPAIPAHAQSVFDDKLSYAVIDLGGDDRGALALGRYAEHINNENNYDMLLVINKYRPLTRDVKALTQIRDEIEKSAGVVFTGIVSNPNIAAQTEPDDILSSDVFADEISHVLNLPVKFTAVRRDIADKVNIAHVFPVDIFQKEIWKV